MLLNFASPVYAAEAWGENCVQGDVATIQGIECLLKNIISPIPALIALVAVGMIIYSGIRLISADPGDSKAVSGAWATMTYAIFGLVLLVVVWFALYLVEQFTGAKVTEFTLIPSP